MTWGSRPGERRGGRAKGTPNKFTAHRSALERSGYEGYRLTEPNGLKPLAKEVLEICMLKATKMAEYYAPVAVLDQEQVAKHPDEVQFALWLRLAADFANKLAPYQSPALKAILTKDVSDDASVFQQAQTREEVLQKLEERAGPKGRKLFEDFMQKVAELEAEYGQEARSRGVPSWPAKAST